MDQLTEDILSRGIRQPLLARRLPGIRYQLLAGGRRLDAARRIGLQSVPVMVVDVDERTAIAIALVHTLGREGLTPWEVAQGLAELVDTLRHLGENDHPVRVASLLDHTQEWVSRLLPIAKYLTPSVLEQAGVGVHDMNVLSEEDLVSAAACADPAERAERLREAHRARRDHRDPGT
jgi:ParB/RepB/Spo0J family partition protein